MVVSGSRGRKEREWESVIRGMSNDSMSLNRPIKHVAAARAYLSLGNDHVPVCNLSIFHAPNR